MAAGVWRQMAACGRRRAAGVRRRGTGERIAHGESGHLPAYLGAGVLGLLVGITELVARYRDDPLAVIRAEPGLIYVGVNMAVALVVFWLLHTGQLGGNVFGNSVSTRHPISPVRAMVRAMVQAITWAPVVEGSIFGTAGNRPD